MALKQLTAAIQNYDPGDLGGMDCIRDLVAAAVAASEGEPSEAEALLSCLLDAFSAAGAKDQAVLDDMLLEVLPGIAVLAQQSSACSKSLAAICSLMAAACSPRDTITAFLEVLGNLAADSPNPDSLQFACGVMVLLPQQVAKLSRRKAANAVECCSAAIMLAKVHGELLANWLLNQLRVAAQQSTAAAAFSSGAPAASAQTLDRLDTFLAASWQAYVEFAQGLAQQVLQEESDPEGRKTVGGALSTLVLELLQVLTATWPPPTLRPLFLQLLRAPGSAQLMPSAESVAAPTRMLAVGRCGSSMHSTQQEHSQKQQHPEQLGSGAAHDSHAEAAVHELLQLLEACGAMSWQQLPCTGSAAAGAGLAVLYSSIMGGQQDVDVLAPPTDAQQAIQLACHWCCAIVEASEDNMLAIAKALALLQLAAALAQQLQHISTHPEEPAGPSSARTKTGTAAAAASAVAVAHDPQPATQLAAHSQQPLSATSTSGFSSGDADQAAMQLVPALQPCVNLLGCIIAQAPLQVLKSQASLALQQLLQALQPPACYVCLQQLLLLRGPAEGGVHPEVAALLMQEVRLLLAQDTAGATFTPSSCMQLVLPWLQQEGPVGWQAGDNLPDRANAVCAALAVIRLGLLRSRTASSRSSSCIGAGAEHELKAVLTVLSGAVATVLQSLQAANSTEHGVQAGGVVGRPDGRVCVPGKAQGAGQAVDAWLAVSRLQDVLDRALELLRDRGALVMC